MDKPIQLAIEDVRLKLNSEIANIINESGLPMCCINPILRNIYERCVDIENQQLETAKAEYSKNQSKQSNETQGVD